MHLVPALLPSLTTIPYSLLAGGYNRKAEVTARITMHKITCVLESSLLENTKEQKTRDDRAMVSKLSDKRTPQAGMKKNINHTGEKS